jgi:hypothetical protein
MKLNDIEEEIILLKASEELIDSMVNFEVISLDGRDPGSYISFKPITHQKFFNIILVDFLSRTDKKVVVKQTSFFGGIKSICKNPNFDIDGSVSQFGNAANEFSDRLEQEIKVDIWLPRIGTETTLKISRLRFLKMCGNISKHNFLRSAGPAEQLRDILESCGVSISLDDVLPKLGDFYERFRTDILGYHGSCLAEFLNNILWEIYQYLLSEFRRSIVWEGGDPPRYRYTYPKTVTSEFAKKCYWELMNELRSAPYMRKLV